MKRRTFLKIAGLSGISFAGCNTRSDKKLFSLLHAPEDTIAGQATWYATTCRECPAGCGIIAKNREGRVIKIEGNPLHPINNGKLCMRGQAALQGVYHPDRIRSPLLKDGAGWKPISHSRARVIIRNKAARAVENGTNLVRMISGVVGESLSRVFSNSLGQWRSDGPLFFEPFAYESLKTANHKILGRDNLVSYHMEKADMLVSLGADFLETWLSPVEYARKFKTMHGTGKNGKGLFFHVGPIRCLTCANADYWLACRPGSEIFIALGMIRETLSHGRQAVLLDESEDRLKQFCTSYTPEKVVQLSGVSPVLYQKLINRLKTARSPLILGTGTASPGPYALQTDIAANMLNRILDPALSLFCFSGTHRVETAHRRSRVVEFFAGLTETPPDLLLIYQSNPGFCLSKDVGVKEALKQPSMFTVCFTQMMDETASMADLIIPVGHFLESWDEYAGKTGMASFIQPATASLYKAPGIGDFFLDAMSGPGKSPDTMKGYVAESFLSTGRIRDATELIRAIGRGGVLEPPPDLPPHLPLSLFPGDCETLFAEVDYKPTRETTFAAVPGIRFFDGRSAQHPWLCEVPDSMTQVAWQSPVLVHPNTAEEYGIRHEESVIIKSVHGEVTAPVYVTDNVVSGVLAMGIGQGHSQGGRYARNMGADPIALLSGKTHPVSGGPGWAIHGVSIVSLKKIDKLAHTDGSLFQHGRKIALTALVSDPPHESGKHDAGHGLSMNEFPLTLPLARGYDASRDIYPVHDHKDYRWAMVVDLDRCIGCNACTVACYAENNIGITGRERIIEGREMAWLRLERYYEPVSGQQQTGRVIFFPMMCQHCDNAPCESVCPVYAPHHSKEGLNNQVYNRCIGTRFCSQNCPYKVRRFNWFDWQWPKPLDMQLNPEVTVRSKGVMEKCSFCVQRIKQAHGIAKDEDRAIKDGEVVPACAQTCPTDALVFGNLMDPKSRVAELVKSSRAYQAMGYLNTKPAVIYLKKVVWEI